MDRAPYDIQEIYTAFQPKILRYLTRLVGENEAEDLTQEVMLKASQALGGFRGESSLSTWLYRIATNVAYDRMRSASFQRTADHLPIEDTLTEEIEEICDCDPLTGEAYPLVEQQLVSQEMSQCIQSTIARLPDSYRTVLVLSDLEGFSNQEIAGILGITLPTVKIRLHRARANLREEFLSHCDYYWVSELGWQAFPIPL